MILIIEFDVTIRTQAVPSWGPSGISNGTLCCLLPGQFHTGALQIPPAVVSNHGHAILAQIRKVPGILILILFVTVKIATTTYAFICEG